MRKLQFKSVKKITYVLFILTLTLSACGQQKKKSNTKETAQTEVKVPDIELMAAVVSGNLEAVKQHIEAGTDLNKKDAMSGATALMSAITFDKTEITKALIDADADLSIKNNDGSTALHVAAFFGRVEAVQMLIDAKADKSVKNTFGATARESVLAPFADMKPIYDMMQQQLGPIGLQLDFDELEKSRPVIAMMLQ
ncbi:ankyrin repeat domain-containing protein [Maribacter luteus]|uniref:Ankyrin repeat domain-containing protein n=1 Tax=Maribacter luteus TaxID=2594478 RepID=A0A6I2MS58_9FLAO|nr:ankyrin repeat domain-containing protein [Maribacter luteus]MRX64076.1 ankyrin repeat domain-containing protein [Maribacter luteus]